MFKMVGIVFIAFILNIIYRTNASNNHSIHHFLFVCLWLHHFFCCVLSVLLAKSFMYEISQFKKKTAQTFKKKLKIKNKNKNKKASAPVTNPTLLPTTVPSLVPTVSPTLFPTSLSEYTVHIYVDLNIVSSDINYFNQWFTRTRYEELTTFTKRIFKQKGGFFINYYQFYVKFETINSTINTTMLPFQFNTQSLSSDALTFYNFKTNNAIYTLDCQMVVHCTTYVENVFRDFFTNPISKASIEVLCVFSFFLFDFFVFFSLFVALFLKLTTKHIFFCACFFEPL